MALLLANKADVAISNRPPQRDTPLHVAVQSRHIECVKLLIRAGANPYVRNDNGQSPYSMAQSLGDGFMRTMAQELLERRLRQPEYDSEENDEEESNSTTPVTETNVDTPS